MSRIGITGNVDVVLATGIKYVLEELAFILSYQTLELSTKPVSDHGVGGFNYLYYESWPVFENLVNGKYDNRFKKGIGFVIAKIGET